MSTPNTVRQNNRRTTTDELALMWAWLEGCCTSLYGEVQGKTLAKRVSLKVGTMLWRGQLARTPDLYN